MLASYKRGLDVVMRHQFFTLCVFIATVATTVAATVGWAAAAAAAALPAATAKVYTPTHLGRRPSEVRVRTLRP